MSTTYLLAYVFITLVIGTVCLGGVAVAGRHRADHLTRSFVLFYLALTVAVITSLVLGVLDLTGAPESAATGTANYFDSIVARYAVMLTLPLFVHSLFGIHSAARRTAVVVVVAVTLFAQHITEFVVGGVWDPRGDVVEDVVFALIVVYALWTAATRFSEVRGPIVERLLLLFVLAVPAIAHDLFFVDGWGLRLYPILYCALGVSMLSGLLAAPAEAGQDSPTAWNLTKREVDVLRLLREGSSTSEIAQALYISPNTVKSHVRSIFDKSGIRTRVGLVASLASRPESNPPPLHMNR